MGCLIHFYKSFRSQTYTMDISLTSSLPSITFLTNPKETAMVFVPTLAVMVAIGFYSIISVVSTSCLLMLLAVFLSKAYTHVMVNLLSKLPADPSSDPLHKMYTVDLTIKAECVEIVIDSVVSGINTGLGQLRSLFLFDNLMESMKFGVAMYSVTYIGSVCNLLTIVIMAWITAFTFPRLYVDNQTVIDGLVEKMYEQLEQIKSKTLSLVSKKGVPVPVTTPVKTRDKTPEKEEEE